MTRKLLILTCLMATMFVSYGKKKKKSDPAPQTQNSGEVFDPTDYKSLGAPMPDIRAVTRQNEVITQKDVVNDAGLVVMLFNPTCEHCQDAARYIMANMDRVKKSNILMMAAPNMVGNWLDMFNDYTKIYSEPRIKLGVDSAGFIRKTYNYEGLPQINIYKGGKLFKFYNKDAAADSLFKYIE